MLSINYISVFGQEHYQACGYHAVKRLIGSHLFSLISTEVVKKSGNSRFNANQNMKGLSDALIQYETLAKSFWSFLTFLFHLMDQIESDCRICIPFLVTQNHPTDLVQERRATDFNASKLWKGRSGQQSQKKFYSKPNRRFFLTDDHPEKKRVFSMKENPYLARS